MEDALLRIAFKWGLPVGLIVAMAAIGRHLDIAGWIGVIVGAVIALAIHGVARDLREELDVEVDDD